MSDHGDGPPRLDPETLEKLRRGIPLRMDAMGELWFADDPIEHPRVRKVFREGLDLSEGGEPIMRIREQWCYITVADCPLRVTGVELQGDALHGRLDDGRTLPIDLDTLWEEPGAGLRCTVPSRHSGRPLSARFTNSAQMGLAGLLEAAGDGTDLRVGDLRHRIPTRAPT